MTTILTPRGLKRKEQNYESLGRIGRATGLTVGDLGPRDEHGLEPIDALFSSPEKAPPKQNSIHDQSTIVEGDMDETVNIESSKKSQKQTLMLEKQLRRSLTWRFPTLGGIPDPVEVLSARSSNVILPPPRSRLPIQTHLGSSPRRSLGPLSSPTREEQNETPTRRAQSQQPMRKLNFSMNDSSSSIIKSTIRQNPLERSQDVKPPKAAGGKRKRASADADQGHDVSVDEGDTSRMNGTTISGLQEDTPLLPVDDEPLVIDDESLIIPDGGNEVTTVDPSQLAGEAEIISPSIEKDPNPPPKKGAKRKGRPPRTSTNSLAQVEIPIVATPKKRGKPPTKKRKPTIHQDGPSEPAMPPPAKRTQKRRSVLGTKDSNTKVKTSKRTDESILLSPTKSRFVARSETPGDELSFRTTRAGRNVVKPLAWWRGESAIYGGTKLEKGQLVLPSIKEVIRTDEVPEPMKRKVPGQPRRRRPKRRPEEDDPELEDDDLDYWETEGGIMQASVMLYDPVHGTGDDSQLEEADVAYAASAIQMRDISGAEFRFAKTLTLPFFGTGMVDLPPGGIKRIKNSRRMQMVFFVFYGRVTVELGTPLQTFSIGRGGMWQVPRGNFYGIYNHSEKPARVFFAQGCETESETFEA
ncbi:MAG: hypothetical protein LQ351_006630 [Letrouitia transgressa]|nr:MAG: hypothetical protein LQ351_006630 [Letrouitia transgressa]